MNIETEADMEKAAAAIYGKYGCSVLCKGGHQISDANDLLFDGQKSKWFYGQRIDNPNTHGTGCKMCIRDRSYNIASSLEHYVGGNYQMAALIAGGILALISAFLFFGGAQKISIVSSILVPIMACIYIMIGLIITFAHVGELPAIFGEIFRQAFDFKSIFGGFAGSCMVWGVKRGLFSNEAGMGLSLIHI